MFHNVKQVITILTISLIIISVFPGTILAAGYGEGNYGAGKYGIGEEETTPTNPVEGTVNNVLNFIQNLTSPSTPTCEQSTAGSKAPWLYAAIAQNGNAIQLYFTEADDPLDHYALEFGTKSGEYSWGATNIGGKGSRTYLVQSLMPNTDYYFRVRAGNGCAPGTWSNEISARTKSLVSYNQLQATDFQFEKSASTVESNESSTSDAETESCSTYTVETGDSLWNIAANELEDGSKYVDIIEQNKDTYPSLENSNAVSVGWELRLRCDATTQKELSRNSSDDQNTGGFILNVKVQNNDQKLLSGVRVVLHPIGKEMFTDGSGKARFEDLEPGVYTVGISQDGFESEQSIDLSGEEKEFDLNMTVEPKKIITSRLVLGIIGGAVVLMMILIAFFTQLRAKRK